MRLPPEASMLEWDVVHGLQELMYRLDVYCIGNNQV